MYFLAQKKNRNIWMENEFPESQIDLCIETSLTGLIRFIYFSCLLLDLPSVEFKARIFIGLGLLFCYPCTSGSGFPVVIIVCWVVFISESRQSLFYAVRG